MSAPHIATAARTTSPKRREKFLAVQEARGDLWDVRFDESLLTPELLTRLTAPLHMVEGSQTSAVDHAICDVVRRHVPHAQHTLIESASHMMPLTHPETLTSVLHAGIERRRPAIVGAPVAEASGVR